MRHFPINLGERFESAHGEQRMAQPHHYGDEGNAWRDRPFQPAERIVTEMNIGPVREGNGLISLREDRKQTPTDEYYHHHGCDLHDAQGFLARFVDADDVLPPEV